VRAKRDFFNIMTIRSQVQYFIFTLEFKKPAFRPVTSSETKAFLYRNQRLCPYLDRPFAS